MIRSTFIFLQFGESCWVSIQQMFVDKKIHSFQKSSWSVLILGIRHWLVKSKCHIFVVILISKVIKVDRVISETGRPKKASVLHIKIFLVFSKNVSEIADKRGEGFL